MICCISIAMVFIQGQFPDTFLGSISVGSDPVDLCISPDGTRAYAAVEFGYATAVDILGYDSFDLAGLVSIDGTPSAVECSGNGEVLYVADSENSMVHVVDTATLEVTGSFPVQPAPVDMVLSAEHGRVFLSHSGGMVTVISTGTSQVEEVFWAGNSLNSLTVSPCGNYVYASDAASPEEAVINAGTLSVTRFNSGMDSMASAVSGCGEWLYLSSTDWDLIGVVDTGDLGLDTTFSCTGEAPADMAALPELPYLYGVDADGGGLVVYSTGDLSFLGTIAVPGEPVNLEIHPDGERIFMVCTGDNRMKVIGYDPSGIQGNEGAAILTAESPSVNPSVTARGFSGELTLRAWDLSGRMVWEGRSTASQGEACEFFIRGASSGVLLVRAESGDLSATASMVVLKP